MQYIFLLSKPRSGSTLFRLLLGQLKNVVSLPETHFFVFHKQNKSLDFSGNKEKIVDRWLKFYTIRKFKIDKTALRKHLLTTTNSWRDLFEETVNFYLKSRQKVNVSFVIEKSPPHIFFQKEIDKMFQDAEKLFLVRDPRSVIASSLTMSWSTHNVLTLARGWKKAIGTVDPDNFIKYEDLVDQNPNIINFLESKFDLHIDKENFFSVMPDQHEEGKHSQQNTH